MKKIILSIIMLNVMILFTACGSTTINNTTVGDEPTQPSEPQEFSLIGSIDCRNVNDYGGEVKLKAKVAYSDNINRDSFTYTYAMNGNVIDFETPIVSMTGDGSAYLLNSNMYVYPNESGVEAWHIFELTYLTKGVVQLFRGGCKQDVYVSSATIASKCPYKKD